MRAAEANAARFTANGGRGVVLRFGEFQAPDSDHADAVFGAARKGVFLDLGASDGYRPTIDADDAAAAVVAALDAPAGIYDIVDDEPITRRDYAAALAAAVGRRRLHLPPAAGVAAAKAGPLAASQRVSNRRLPRRDRMAGRDSQPARRGPPDRAASWAIEPALGPTARVAALAARGRRASALGIYAAFFPRAFYDDFPFGRRWVAHDGPYNEHLVRDFGAMNLALAAVTLARAVLRLARRPRGPRRSAGSCSRCRTPCTTSGISSHYETADKVGNVVSLGFAVLLAIAALVALARPPARAGGASSYDGGGGEPVPVERLQPFGTTIFAEMSALARRDRVDQPRARAFPTPTVPTS